MTFAVREVTSGTGWVSNQDALSKPADQDERRLRARYSFWRTQTRTFQISLDQFDSSTFSNLNSPNVYNLTIDTPVETQADLPHAWRTKTSALLEYLVDITQVSIPVEISDKSLGDIFTGLSSAVREQVDSAFASGEREAREDEFESNFAIQLANLISQHGIIALSEISRKLKDSHTDVDLLTDALIVIGSIRDDTTHQPRFRLLLHFLKSPVPRVRYGSLKGLASLYDRRAVEDVRSALETEQVPILRSVMKHVINYLEHD